MSIFRGPKEGTLPDGSVVATQGDISEALTTAQQAQAAAEAAQAAAESTLDDFDDRYLGAKSSDPTVDNDGDALIDGALYYNTGTNITKVYDVSSGQWFNVKPTDSEQTNINTVAGIAVDVETVSNNISDVQEVSSNLSGADTIGTVAGSISNVDTTGNNISSVNTVAGELGAGLDVTVVAGDLEGTDTIGTVANSISDVNTAADNITAIQNAPQFASDAEDAQGYAEEWAIKTEDTPVSVDAGGDGTNDFSALHHAAKASASASAASTSESNALTSEQNAATSENNALTSEQNASQSESNAATSEQNAQQAATEAETALDNFTDQYLGAKSTEPSTDNDGDPLVTGAIYYDTTDEQLYIWDGSNWEAAAFSASGTVLSFNGRDGVVTLQSSDVTGALGFTPEDSATAYDSSDFTTDFASETTDNLSEGTSNLYYTDARTRNALASSGDISYDSATGTFSYTERTDSQIRGLFSASGDLNYDSATGEFSVTVPAGYDSSDFNTDFGTKDTDDLTEGTGNLYYTDTRARGAVSASGDLSYNPSTGVFSFTETPNYSDSDVDAHLSGGSGVNYSSGTISHSDTSTQSSVNNSGSDVIQSVTLDDFGHVTSLSSTSISAGGVGSRVRLNGSGTFTVPAGIEKIRVFIVGAGAGGGRTDTVLGSDGGSSSFGSFSAGGGERRDRDFAIVSGLGGFGGGTGCRGGTGGTYNGGDSGGFGGGGAGNYIDAPSKDDGVDGGGGGGELSGGGGGLNVQDINTSPGSTFSYSCGSGGAGNDGGNGGDGFIVVEY